MTNAEIALEALKIAMPLLRDIIIALLGGVAGLAFWKNWYKKEKRFFSNVKKPYTVFRLTNKVSDMEMEMEMLKQNGLFSKPYSILTDPRSLDWVREQSLVIIAIDQSTQEASFKEVYREAKAANIPVIIYTLGDNKVALCESDLVKSYSKRVIVNQPLRLVSDIFTILATTPTKNE